MEEQRIKHLRYLLERAKAEMGKCEVNGYELNALSLQIYIGFLTEWISDMKQEKTP